MVTKSRPVDEQDIARRAYEIYESRGAAGGAAAPVVGAFGQKRD